MADLPTEKKSKYLRSGMLKYLLKFLAGRTMFALLLLVSLVLAAVSVWQRAVNPLLDESLIVSEQTIAVVKANTADLQLIIDRRSERINHVPRSFARFSRLFQTISASPTPSPTPSVAANPTGG